METTIENINGAEIIRLRGKLDSTNATEFDTQLRELGKSEDVRCVILELSGISTLTSAPLRNILSLTKRLKQINIRLFLAAPSQNCLEALQISGFLKFKLFEIAASVEAILPMVPSMPTATRAAAAPSEAAQQPQGRPSQLGGAGVSARPQPAAPSPSLPSPYLSQPAQPAQEEEEAVPSRGTVVDVLYTIRYWVAKIIGF